MQLRVGAPSKFETEKTYVIHVLLKVYLGLDYDLYFHDEAEYRIEWDNKKVKFESHFWLSQHNYLTSENIPERTLMAESLDSSETLPVIYGRDFYERSEEEIRCGLDVFASSFFMLTRWEEYVLPDRDNHGRFPHEASLAYKNNFLTKAVVNGYVVLIKRELTKLGFQEKFKQHQFSLLNTCDVDSPFMWRSFRNLVGRLKYQITVGKLKKWFASDVPSYWGTTARKKRDPYDTYDYLMDTSEKAGVLSHFFFMDYGHTKYDRYYHLSEPRMQEVVNNIESRGHKIGFHASYALMNDQQKFKAGLREVKSQTGSGFLSIGRHHFLRFELPTTWSIWDAEGMEWDATLGYSGHNGFRCGTCYPFPVFDVVQRKMLKLFERPLIFMEQSSITNRKMKPEQVELEALQLLKEVKKYNGEFVLLWHNATLNSSEFKPFKKVYEYIIDNFIALKKR